MISFGDYLRMREGLLAAEPTGNGLPRINTTPLTQAQRKKLVAVPVHPPEPLAPVIHPVAPVIPQKFIKTMRPISPPRR